MTTPAFIRPHRSLALWAALAVVMVISSYVIVLIVAVACVYGPYLMWVNVESSRLQSAILLLSGVAMAGTIVWSLVPRRDRFDPQGPKLDRATHPQLFDEIEHIAKLFDETAPDEVYLLPYLNAFVADRGGVLGFGNRRIMGVGLPLVGILNVAEFRAVLAHEFAHYYHGDTRLGPWVYKTRMSMVRTIQNMTSLGTVMRPFYAQIVYGVTMWFLQTYWNAIFSAMQMIARRQEYRADELACLVTGPQALISGLRKIHGGAAAFPTYWSSSVIPLLHLRLRIPVAEGFGLFVAAPKVAQGIDRFLEHEVNKLPQQPYDSHPRLADRILAAKWRTIPAVWPGSDLPATTLFGDLLADERRIFEMSNPSTPLSEFQAVTWNELPTVLPVAWRGFVQENAHVFGEVAAESLPEVLQRLPDIAAKVPNPKGMLLGRAERAVLAAGVLETALTLALLDAGWHLRFVPGDVCVEREGERLKVYQVINDVASKRVRPDAWVARCRVLGIAGSSLFPS